MEKEMNIYYMRPYRSACILIQTKHNDRTKRTKPTKIATKLNIPVQSLRHAHKVFKTEEKKIHTKMAAQLLL